MTSASLRSRPEGFHSGSSQQSLLERAKRIVQYRRILDLLVRRDLKVRYAGSALGYVWTVLDPLLMSLVYWFVFVKIFGRDAGPQNRPYMLYLVTGQLIWAWFNGGVQATARALRSEAQMVRSSNVPRELWILRVAVSKGVEYVFGLPVLVIYGARVLDAPDVGGLAAALRRADVLRAADGVRPHAGAARGAGTATSSGSSRSSCGSFFYASPVLYSDERLPPSIRFVYNFNPMVGRARRCRALEEDLLQRPTLNAVYIARTRQSVPCSIFADRRARLRSPRACRGSRKSDDLSPLSAPEPIISLRDVGVQFSLNRRRKRSLKNLLMQGPRRTAPTSSGRSATSASTSIRARPSASSDAMGRANRRCSA